MSEKQILEKRGFLSLFSVSELGILLRKSENLYLFSPEFGGNFGKRRIMTAVNDIATRKGKPKSAKVRRRK